jgi:hypothetical protein
MENSRSVIFIAVSLATVIAGAAFAQTTPQNPSPAQAGADPSMAQPQGSNIPAANTPPPVQNPESTVGLAPADQPTNNAKPNVAGQIVPSSRETAAHNPSILLHDHQPIITHTFNFTAEQKRTVVDALAQEKDVILGNKVDLAEAVVLPRSIDVKPIPDRVSQAMPWVKGYGYVKTGGQIVLVEPNIRYVAAIIK